MSNLERYAIRMIRWSAYGALTGVFLILATSAFSSGCEEGAMSYSNCVSFGRDSSTLVTFSYITGGMLVAGSSLIFLINIFLLGIAKNRAYRSK
jgi:hypothetical protein